MRLKALTTAVLSAAALAGAAHAGSVVNTGGPNNLVGWNLTSDQWIGGQFNLAADTTITEILGYLDASEGTLTFAVHQDDGTDIPGAELFSQAFASDGTAGFQGLHGLSWLLAAGSYYVTAEVRTGQTFDGHFQGASRHPLNHEVFTQGGQWLGGDGLAVAWRINDTSGGPVPEPVAWTLMITGLGMAGAMLRRQRAAA